MTPASPPLPLGRIDWDAVGRMPDPEAAALLDGRARALCAILRTAFIELGAIVSCCEKRMLWQHVRSSDTLEPFTSFNQWLIHAAPYSRSVCYEAKRIVEELTKDVPLNRLMGVNETNARVLMQVSSGLRPKLLEAAKTLPEKEFISKIQAAYPEQHVEQRQPVLMASTGASAKIDQAIEWAIALYGCKTRGEALEAVCEDFCLAHQDMMGPELEESGTGDYPA